MSGYGCRVSSYKLKRGGGRVYVPRFPVRNEVSRSLVEDAVLLGDDSLMVGYVVFAWDHELNTGCAYKWVDDVVNPSSLPLFLSDRFSEVLRLHGHKD